VWVVACWETGLIVAGLAGHMFYVNHEDRQDGWQRFDALSKLFETGTLPQTKYSMVGPLFASPLWWLGKVVKDPLWWCDRYNTILLGLGMLAIWLLLRKRVPSRMLRVFFLLLVAGSMFGNHMRFFYGEAFTVVLVAVGVVAAVVGPRLAGWITTVIGIVNTPATVAGLVTMVGERVLRTRRLRYGVAVVATVAAILVANRLQRGNAFDTGYHDDKGYQSIMPYSGLPNWSNPMVFGLMGFIFSAGKGLIWFAPGLFLPMRRALDGFGDEVRVIYRQWVAFVIGLLLVYSMWWSWQGGWFWGPRFLLFASVPASFALAVAWWRREHLSVFVTLFATVGIGLSIWVGIDGAVYGDSALWDSCVTNYMYELPLCSYTPEFGVLWYPFVRPSDVAFDQKLYFGYCLVVGVYLVVPMLVTLGRQVAAHGRDAGWLTWRYRW